MRTAIGTLAILLTFSTAGPAVAQETDVERIERVVAPRPIGAGVRNDGVRVVRPGALLLASFDRNGDGRVSPSELSDGAKVSFRFADRNADGVLSGFEQSDWAGVIGGLEDVLSNPMLFDTDLDRSVTPTEFEAGLRRMSEGYSDAAGNIAFSALIQPLTPGARPGEAGARTPGGGRR